MFHFLNQVSGFFFCVQYSSICISGPKPDPCWTIAVIRPFLFVDSFLYFYSECTVFCFYFDLMFQQTLLNVVSTSRKKGYTIALHIVNVVSFVFQFLNSLLSLLICWFFGNKSIDMVPLALALKIKVLPLPCFYTYIQKDGNLSPTLLNDLLLTHKNF